MSSKSQSLKKKDAECAQTLRVLDHYLLLPDFLPMTACPLWMAATALLSISFPILMVCSQVLPIVVSILLIHSEIVTIPTPILAISS
jgi:hypothetical protein